MPSDLLSQRETDFLRGAAAYLENPSYLIRLADYFGRPVQELARRVLPQKVAGVAGTALRRAMGLAIVTIPGGLDDDREFDEAHDSAAWTAFWHKMSTVATGFGGGLMGVGGLAIELPISTGIMFRSIASVAGQMGEDLRDPAARLECLSVFSHGGPASEEDAMESSYLTARLAVAGLIEEAALFVSRETAQTVAEAMARGTAPVLVNLIARLAARFEVTVSQKLVGQCLPMIGGLGGAVLNAAFAEHFNTVARYHFGIRKLERQFGAPSVQAAYRAELRQLRGG